MNYFKTYRNGIQLNNRYYVFKITHSSIRDNLFDGIGLAKRRLNDKTLQQSAQNAFRHVNFKRLS